uniref:Abasic site processing protein HMCES n=1 Tax=Oncorhynchus kisutch TaxID=8019 RepID=A0A8C7H5M0_ONCKI
TCGRTASQIHGQQSLRQRCFILADGFYEWRQEKDKQPFIYFPQTQGSAHVKTEDQDEGTPYKEDTDIGWLLLTITYTVITLGTSPIIKASMTGMDALKLLQSKNKLTFHTVSSLVNNSQKHFPSELKPSAGSKMMMGWLKSSTPSKRKEPDTGEVKQEGHTGETRPEKQPKTAGPLQQWLWEQTEECMSYCLEMEERKWFDYFYVWCRLKIM